MRARVAPLPSIVCCRDMYVLLSSASPVTGTAGHGNNTDMVMVP